MDGKPSPSIPKALIKYLERPDFVYRGFNCRMFIERGTGIIFGLIEGIEGNVDFPSFRVDGNELPADIFLAEVEVLFHKRIDDYLAACDELESTELKKH